MLGLAASAGIEAGSIITNGRGSTPMCQIAQSNGHIFPRLFEERVSRAATLIDKIVVGQLPSFGVYGLPSGSTICDVR
jgi:hypothetical protein